MATKPKPGDWVGLAMHRQVPGVTRDTLREEAIERLIEWNALQSLRKYELAPGWTVAGVLNDLVPQYYRDVAAELAARPPGTRLKPMELKTKVNLKGD